VFIYIIAPLVTEKKVLSGVDTLPEVIISEISSPSVSPIEVISDDENGFSATQSPTLGITITVSPIIHQKNETEPTPSAYLPKAPENLEVFFNKYADKYKIHVDLLKKIAYCESRFDNNAINGDYVGLFQFGRNTWTNYRSQMGLNVNPDLRFGGEESIDTAAYVVSLGLYRNLWPNCI